MRPSVSIALANGQLGILPPTEWGTSVLLVSAPAAPTAGYGNWFLIRTKSDADAAFAATANAPVVAAIKKGFYAEAPEGTKLYVLAMAQATTLQTLVAAANAEKALTAANGGARLLAAIKYPSNSYTPTITNGFDVDVHNAVTDAQTLANTWFGLKKPFRFFIEGYAFSGVPSAAKDYSVTTNRNGHIVASEVAADGGIATLMAMGRAAKLAPQENIGKIKKGSLAILDTDAVTLGGVAIDSFTDSFYETMYDKRYITIERNRVASGYVFTDDSSLVVSTDDYNNLRNGRVIDNMTRVAFNTYYQQLKDDVDIDADGRLSISVEKALEAEIIKDINQQMGTQLSSNSDGTAAVFCSVNPDPVKYPALYQANSISSPNLNLLTSGGQIYVFLNGRPKGCLKSISIVLGFAYT